MRRFKYFLFFSLIIVLLFSKNIFPQKINNSVGLNVFNSFTLWKHPIPQVGYDNLGVGTFLSPIYKMNINNFYFQFDFMLSYFHFTGPNDLTETGPADDIDAGFHSHMNRNDLGIVVGYNLFDNLTLFIKSKFNYLQISGSVDSKEIIESPFNYIERGFLIGPGINLNYPKINSNSYFTFSISYLMGNLNYIYNSFRTEIQSPYKNNITTQLFTTNLGYNINLSSKFLLGVSFESDYYFKKKYFSEFEYDYNYNSDLWFIGLNTGVFYLF